MDGTEPKMWESVFLSLAFFFCHFLLLVPMYEFSHLHCHGVKIEIDLRLRSRVETQYEVILHMITLLLIFKQ